ncbi:MAG: ATPase, T2SS/T4P/T4SS family [Lachnospiraceae bacterium]
MRTPETIETALAAAETGHLVFSTIHTIPRWTALTASSVSFRRTTAPDQDAVIHDIKAVLSQQLVLRNGQGVAACELMMITPPIKNLIRDGKTPQMSSSCSGRRMDP